MERVISFKQGLSGIGTEKGRHYTNQEVLKRLNNVQSALSKGILEKAQSECLSEGELIKCFEMLAEEYGLSTSKRFLRFKESFLGLGFTIGAYVDGMAGEKSTQKALKLVSLDKGVKILYNICFDYNGCQTEYDAIVIAPYGLFVIEVNHWCGTIILTSNGLVVHETCQAYDLIGKINAKMALLKEYLGDMFPMRYYNMLFFSNEKVKIVDDYHRLPYYVDCGMSLGIRSYSKSGAILSEKEISKIVDLIKSKHKEKLTLCPVSCEQIIDDYVHIMMEIEEQAKEKNINHED